MLLWSRYKVMKEHSVHARHLTGDWSHHHTCWTTIDNHARVTAPPVAACRHAAGGSGPILPRGGYVIPHSSRVRSKLLFPGLGVAQLGPNTKKRLPATATAAAAASAALITTRARSEQLNAASSICKHRLGDTAKTRFPRRDQSRV